jgi:hypothetical protein
MHPLEKRRLCTAHAKSGHSHIAALLALPKNKNPAAAGSVLIRMLSLRRNGYSPFGLFIQYVNGNRSQLINQLAAATIYKAVALEKRGLRDL